VSSVPIVGGTPLWSSFGGGEDVFTEIGCMECCNAAWKAMSGVSER
jgi:hypothetical protein